jgi:protein ImuA
MSSVPQSHDVDLSRPVALSPPDSRAPLIAGLRRQLSRWETAIAADEATVFSCGAPAIDRLLPSGGLRYGMLVEWIAGSSAPETISKPSPPGRGQSESGSPNKNAPSPQPSPIGRGSAATLGLMSAREACRDGGVLVVIDRPQTFYPPAAAAWGIDLDRLIVVRPQSARDELWAVVQALRSPAVAAMWAAIDRLDSRAFRRLQLAAQAGRTLGVLMRPARARRQPSWADVTLEVGPRAKSRGSSARIPALGSRLSTLDFHRLVHVQLVRCHHGRPGGSAMLEIDDATYTVREAEGGYRLSAIGYRPGLLAESR